MRNLLTCAMLVASPAFAAQVYKCKGSNGEVSFTDLHFEHEGGGQQDGTCEFAAMSADNETAGGGG